MRNPSTIADELGALSAKIEPYVPIDAALEAQAIELLVEFARSVSATLEAAGLVVVPEPLELPPIHVDAEPQG